MLVNGNTLTAFTRLVPWIPIRKGFTGAFSQPTFCATGSKASFVRELPNVTSFIAWAKLSFLFGCSYVRHSASSFFLEIETYLGGLLCILLLSLVDDHVAKHFSCPGTIWTEEQ